MHNFKELKVWQKAIDLALDIYHCASSFPSDEKYGLSSQIKRCSVSISSNIAEGSGRNSDKEFKHFLTLSQGSAYELETQLIIAQRLKLIEKAEAAQLIDKTSEIQKMIYSLSQRLSTSAIQS